jgi:hypothetical protein
VHDDVFCPDENSSRWTASRIVAAEKDSHQQPA